MKISIIFLTIATLSIAGCQSNFYTEKDYQSVLKIDSHVHVNSEKGFFEDQPLKENFRLITLNVDHSDSSSVRQQLDWALISTKKYLSLIHISEPTRLGMISYAVFCLKKK